MTLRAKFGDTVSVHFVCRLNDDSIVDSSDGKLPLQLIIGKSGLISGFERAFIGMEPGERKTVIVPAEEAYGPYDDKLKQVLPLSLFPDTIVPEIGMEIRIKQDNEEKIFRVKEVTDTSVTLDGNHHLAGKDLAFDLTLVEILKPGPSAAAHFALGVMIQEQGFLDEALDHYRDAIEIDPDFAEAHFKIGVLYQVKGDYEKAEAHYRRALEVQSEHPDAMINLGNLLRMKGETDRAISYFDRAAELKPNHASIYNNLGVAYRDKGDLDAAILNYRKAIALDENFAEAYNNIGMALQEKGHLLESERSFRKAIEIVPALAEAHFNLATVLLLSGQFKEGWEEYEWRLNVRGLGYESTQPLWSGEDGSGQRLLLVADQGYGDTIQFIRYAPLVAEKGYDVIIACQNELESLLRRVGGVSSIISFGQVLPACDAHCFLLSLPRLFHTTTDTIPARIPYIEADPEMVAQWRKKLTPDPTCLQVGLAWSGRPGHLNDRNRSCPLHLFEPIAHLDGIKLFSLQKEISEQWTTMPLAALNIMDPTADIRDFSDTAAILMSLDLVITVDTAVAHLAGALGRKVWTLLPFAPDWRWMLNREDSPWYPTMRLFRQPAPGDWISVIERVAEELKNLT